MSCATNIERRDSCVRVPSGALPLVSIFGSYTKQSVGDKIILVALLDLMFRVADPALEVEVVAFDKHSIAEAIQPYSWRQRVRVQGVAVRASGGDTPLSNRSRFAWQRALFGLLPPRTQRWVRTRVLLRRLPRAFSPHSRALIIGGGNLLMDLYPALPELLSAAVSEFVKTNRPVSIIGVGAFPISTARGKRLLRGVVSQARRVSVRDEETAEHIHEHWQVPAEVFPDLAFSFPVPSGLSPILLAKKPTVAVNVASVYGPDWPYRDAAKYARYVESVISVLLHVEKQYDGTVEFRFFNTNFPVDYKTSLAIVDRLRSAGISDERVDHIEGLQSPKSTAKIMAGASCAFVTRMHAGILAARMGLPVVAVAYQPKVRDVFKTVGLGHCVVDIGAVTAAADLIKSCMSTPEAYCLDEARRSELDRANKQAVRRLFQGIS